jgi:hypothetical protein
LQNKTFYIKLSINSKTLGYFIYKYLNNNYKNYNFEDFDDELIQLIINDYFPLTSSSDIEIPKNQLNSICSGIKLIQRFTNNDFIVEFYFATGS